MAKKNKYCMIEKGLLANLIVTLKQLNVQGYDSMNMLVGCVSLLSGMYEHGVVGAAPGDFVLEKNEGPEKVEEDSEKEG